MNKKDDTTGNTSYISAFKEAVERNIKIEEVLAERDRANLRKYCLKLAIETLKGSFESFDEQDVIDTANKFMGFIKTKNEKH